MILGIAFALIEAVMLASNRIAAAVAVGNQRTELAVSTPEANRDQAGPCELPTSPLLHQGSCAWHREYSELLDFL